MTCTQKEGGIIMEEMNESKRVRKVMFSEPISFHGYEGIKDYYNDGTYVKYSPAESGIEEYEEGTHNYTEMELALMANPLPSHDPKNDEMARQINNVLSNGTVQQKRNLQQAIKSLMGYSSLEEEMEQRVYRK